MTRVTSIGYKKKNYIPSDTPAEHPYANPEPVPSASKPAGGEVDPSAPRPIAKLPKSRRGTRGKKDKRGKKAGEEKEAGVAAAAPAAGEEEEATSIAAPSTTDATSTHTTTDEQPSSAPAPVEGAEDKEEELVGKQDGERGPDGRKTMAGLKGPKPGETASEHAERMKKKEAQKMRREKDYETRIAASEKRRLDRIAEREASTTCFACREKGHSARECPNNLEGGLEIDGVQSMTGKDAVNICYRCGSPSHSLKQCRTPLNKKDPMPFASCFVCLQKGHLAGSCPKNTAKGVYPEGGSCKICQGKDHLAKDCGLRKDAAITTALLPPSPTRPAGADEDDFHVLKRKHIAVEAEEKDEAEASRKQTKPRLGADRKDKGAGAKPKGKVVAF